MSRSVLLDAVAGADTTITMAADNGQLQLNAFEPIIGLSLLQSITWLRQACWTFRENCVIGITANSELLRARVFTSIGLVTALTPRIGYTAAADVAHAALESGHDIRSLILARGLLTGPEFDLIADPRGLTHSVPAANKRGATGRLDQPSTGRAHLAPAPSRGGDGWVISS